MVTLVVNPGSSSKKYALYRDGVCQFTVRFEHTGEGVGRTTEVAGQQKTSDETTERVYHEALHEVLTQAKNAGVIKTMADITSVGVRVVAPGHLFAKHRPINDQFLHDLKTAERVAPLHVAPVIEELEAAQRNLAHAKIIAVSDSAFHATIPEHRTTYSLKGTSERGIRKFGYHGLSVGSIVHRLPELFDESVQKVIVGHIGSGVSITAVENGKSVHTTMGYTPASGVIMGTRSGDIDPGALIAFMEAESLYGKAAHQYIQTHGGLRGLTGQNDIRQVLLQEEKGSEAASNAMKAFIEYIQQAIASAHVLLGGADALVLTATAMERNNELRERLLHGLGSVGYRVNDMMNERVSSSARLISDPDNSIPIAVIPTDEMGEMVRICEQVAAS